MPIRPENRDRYPVNWRAISFRIRFVRAMGACECKGDCGIEHPGSFGRCEVGHGSRTKEGKRVTLTTAHLDHTPENCSDENLRAMCNACHLRYDAALHRANSARTRASR